MQAQKLRHESYDKLFVQQKCGFFGKSTNYNKKVLKDR